MKRLIFILVICSCLVIWLAGGCEKPASEKAEQDPSSLRYEGRDVIPPEIAGTWEQRDGLWQMTIEPNGVVNSAVIPLLQATIRPNQTIHVEMKDGNFSTFTAGNCIAEFNPQTRELFVYIELKEFLVRYYEIRTGGNRVDTFTGPVSQDGSVWEPEWINVFDYGPELPMDPNNISPTPCIFDKVGKDGSKKTEDGIRK